MPIVSIPQNVLFEKLGRRYTDREFDELCFQFGLELDEITCEKELIARERGQERAIHSSTEKIYKIEIPANRFDLLCPEGLTRALLIFTKQIDVLEYKLNAPAGVQVFVKPNTQDVRPFVVAAVLRNLHLTESAFNSLIELQEKLHHTICRKRSLVAIGTHDLDTLRPPFVYDARSPSSINFTPLNKSERFSAVELMQIYSTDSHLKPYLPLIQDKPKYPVITDSEDVVLSMPPIINGAHSRLTMKTKNLFIEATATDLNKAVIVLDTLVTMFSEYCEEKFTVEPVEVFQHDGSHCVFPRLQYRDEMVSIDYINRLLGVQLSTSEVANLLKRMGLTTSLPMQHSGSSSTPEQNALVPERCGTSTTCPSLLWVRIPPTRHDILHACDIVEDVAIAYGYDNIPETLPQTYCIAHGQPINKLSDLLRFELAQMGFTEALSFSLCSRDDISTKLRLPIEDIPAAHLANPKTSDFQVTRTTLLPGILHTIEHNRKLPLPLKLFEVQDVVLKDASMDVGARNHRRLCAVYYNKHSGFEVIHGVLDRLMKVLSIAWSAAGQSACRADSGQPPRSYSLKELQDPTFFPGRCGSIVLQPGNQMVGRLGVLHPEVLRNFGLAMPCSVLDLDVEVFV